MHVKIQIVSFICVCVQEKQSVTASVFKQALQFQKPKTKGRQIWPPPWAAKGPATPLYTLYSGIINFWELVTSIL